MDGDRQPLAPELYESSTTPQGSSRDEGGSGAQQWPSREWSSDHPVNLRLSIPLLFGRYYVTLVAGKERRSVERRSAERLKHPIGKLGNIIVLFGLGTFVGLAALTLVQIVGISFLKETGLIVVPH